MKLSLIIPCYNEEDIFPQTNEILLSLLKELVDAGKIGADSKVCYIDDGSRDETWSLIEAAAREFDNVEGIKLSRNHGHQHALLAGLLSVDGDVLVSIDADLQDDIRVIPDMIDQHLAGSDIVLGVREDRSSDSFIKRTTATLFYRIIKALGVDIVHNHADFRLMSRRALDALAEYNETNLFLRGVVPNLGFQRSEVSYSRLARDAGETKYSWRRMFSLALSGITAFSAVPLRIIAVIGLSVFVITLLLSAWVFYVRLVQGDAVPGWASSVLPMYFLGGIQLLSLGVIGEYVSRIYVETKRRPRFIIEKRT